MFHRTENLFLRPTFPEDWEAILWGIADKGVVRNLARAPWPYTAEHAREFAKREMDARFPRFLITLPSEHGERLVGCIGMDSTEDGIELGYWIARPYWGRGYATEAVRGVLEVARMLGHRRISAGHFLDNPASGRVLQKAGFEPTGEVSPRMSCARGEKVPCALYAIDLEADMAGAMPVAA